MEVKPKHLTNVRRVSALSARRRSSAGGSATRMADIQDDGHVRVAVRCRPMSDKELSDGYESIVEFESDKRIVVHDVSEQPSDQLGTKSGERRNVSHVYDFDHVFDCESRQQDIYDQVCRQIVDSVLEGYNGTIFAYGQTGTGKTFTMEGSSRRLHKTKRQQQTKLNEKPSSAEGLVDNQDQAGIIPRTFEQIFERIQSQPDIQFLVRASYLEVYQEEIRDLLRKDKTNKLELHERTDIGVYVKDLTSFVCKSISEIERVMRVGNQNRIVGATDMNEHSSRSHAIFMITIEQQRQEHADTKLRQAEESDGNQQITTKQNQFAAASEPVIRVGKLNLVDLAGSERQRKTNSFGQRQKESIKINSSLSALGNVITSLMKLQKQREQQVASSGSARKATIGTNNQSAPVHTPYRDSKLTRLLQDSLGGNAKTLMIANIGPASYNYDETINTLNYASRARCIKNRPRLNEDPKDALLRELQKEIELLRAKLAANQTAGDQLSLKANQSPSDNHSSGVSSAKSSQGSSYSGNSVKEGGILQPTSKQNASSTGQNETNNNEQLLLEKEFFELKQKLSSLESKLLNSDKFDQIQSQSPTRKRELDHQSILKGLTREQELELERRQEELANQAGRERAIRDELERREEAELLAKQSFESIQQEIEAKRRLIWQVLLKVKSIRDEMGAVQQAYRVELDELEQLQFVLQRELKLKCLIMDNFIPNHHVDRLISRMVYDERRSLCLIKSLELPDNDERGQCRIKLAADHPSFTNCRLSDYLQSSTATLNFRRPRSELERLSETINPNNIRYKYENLIEPKLEFIRWHNNRKSQTASPFPSNPVSSRKLYDILGEQVSQQTRRNGEGDKKGQLQALINDALNQHEPDIVI